MCRSERKRSRERRLSALEGGRRGERLRLVSFSSTLEHKSRVLYIKRSLQKSFHLLTRLSNMRFSTLMTVLGADQAGGRYLM
jgi:hypothetical protein